MLSPFFTASLNGISVTIQPPDVQVGYAFKDEVALVEVAHKVGS